MWSQALSRATRREAFRAILARSKVVESLASSMPTGGRNAQLSPEAVLMGMLCALDHGRPAHLIAGCEALWELPVQDQVHLGAQRTQGGVLHPATYRQFSNTHQVMTRAIDPTPVPSFRHVAEDDRPAHLAATRDGVDATAAELRLAMVLDALCEASIPDAYKQVSSSLAVDWTDYETWSRPRRNDDPVPSSDPTASWGHAKGTAPGEKEHLFFGYYPQVATMVPEEKGPQVPELVRRAPFCAPRTDPAKVMADSLVRAYGDGVPPGDVLGDCGFSNRDPDTFAVPLRRAGAALVMDLHPNDRGSEGTYKGAVVANGNLYCPCTPKVLLDHGPLRRGAGDEETAAHDTRSDELARFKLGRVSSNDPDTAHRVMCPAVMGKVRCPLWPESMTRGYTRPEVLSPPEHPPACCLQKTITVEASVNAKSAQKHDYPSRAHRLSYNRRTGAERPFSWLKDPATTGITRGWCRLMGRTKNALMFTLAVVVRNVRIVETFERDQNEAARRAAMGLEPPRRRRRRRRHQDSDPAPAEPAPAEGLATPG